MISLLEIPEKLRERVSEVVDNGDFVIWFNSTWQSALNGGEHFSYADNKAGVIKAIEAAVDCRCEDCIAEGETFKGVRMLNVESARNESSRLQEIRERIQGNREARLKSNPLAAATATERFRPNDGGRFAAGRTGFAGDCVARSIAIALELDYSEVYKAMAEGMGALRDRVPKWAQGSRPKKSASHGVSKKVYEEFLFARGWKWQPTMTIGSGCKVHLKKEELPAGRIICSVSKHMVAMIDGVIHDTYDPSRGGTRCVYGYYYKPEA